MKIINIDIDTKIILRTVTDTDTLKTKSINSKLELPAGNYQSILLNFNFINPKPAGLNLFANFRINEKEQIDVELEEMTVDGQIYKYSCYIPPEVFEERAKVLLGVYALKYNDTTIEERISLVPVLTFVVRGSYDPLKNNEITPTPTIFEFYFQKVNEAAEKIENLKSDKAQFIFPKFWPNALSGDCNLILYHSKVVLIDCYYSEKWQNVKDMLDDHNVNHIDYFICSHYHNDHIQNFENLITNGFIDSNTRLYMPAETTKFNWANAINTYQTMCTTYGLNYYIPQENEILEIDDLKLTFTNCDAEALDAYYPEGSNSQNATSTIVLIEHNNVKALYTGDADNEAYKRLRNLGFVKGQIDLFKIGHHGVNETTDEEFLQNIRPKFAVQPSGIVDFAKNNFGNSAMIKLLSELDTKIYPCHMQNDYITFVSDGFNIHCKKGVPYTVSNYYDRRSITLYVDINSDNMDIQDGSQEHPFHEIMQAIGSIKNYPYNVVAIQLANGDYNTSHEAVNGVKNATFIQFSDNKKIIISGNSSDRTKVTLNGVHIRNSCVVLQNLTSYADKRNAIECYNSSVKLQNVLLTSKIELGEGENYPYEGLFASGSTVYINNCKIDKVNNPLLANDGSTIITNNLTLGTNSGSNTLPINNETNLISNHVIYENISDKLANLERHSSYIQPLILYRDETDNYTVKEATIPVDITDLHAIEIVARNSAGKHVSSGIIYWPTNDYVIPLAIHDASATYTYIQSCTITIQNNKLTIANQKQVRIKDADGTVEITTPNAFKIKRIVGYVNNTNYIDLSS